MSIIVVHSKYVAIFNWLNSPPLIHKKQVLFIFGGCKQYTLDPITYHYWFSEAGLVHGIFV